VRRCPQCGTNNEARSWNCSSCGRRLLAVPPPLPANVRQAVAKDRIVGDVPPDAVPPNPTAPAGVDEQGRMVYVIAAVSAVLLLALFFYAWFVGGNGNL